MRYQNFLDDFELVVKHMIYLYGVLEGNSNNAANWMYSNSFNDLTQLHLEGDAFRHHCVASHEALLSLVDLGC